MTIEHPSFGTLDDNRVIIFDTTLRDGEQSPGFSMNLGEKIRMAEALKELGVDVIEAGFAIASPGDFESVKAIAESVKGPVIASLSRAVEADILRSAEALRPAERRRIHIVLATSPLHMRVKLRLEPDEVIDLTARSVQLARNHAEDVEWSAEDGSRSEMDFLCRCVETAIKYGANTINIPDTVGYALPEDMERIFTALRERVPGAEKVIFSTHNHNDLGLAVANTIAAIRGGARQVECTINGIGERAGNASLEEIAMALRTRHDAIGRTSGITTPNLLRVSRLLSTITGFDVQPNKAIVGRNAFAHESGIHQHGMLRHHSTYEILRPEDVGLSRSHLVLGKHSGRHAFRERVQALGFELDEPEFNRVFEEFKALADKKKELFDGDIEALVLRAEDSAAGPWQLAELTTEAKTGGAARARVILTHNDGSRVEHTATGDGPVDAAFKAIEAATRVAVVLRKFEVHAVSEGEDAQGEARVYVEYNQRSYRGASVSTNIVESGARAFLEVINRIELAQAGTRAREERAAATTA